MPKAAFCGLPHSESEVYYVKSSAIGLTPCRSLHIGQLFIERSLMSQSNGSESSGKGAFFGENSDMNVQGT